MSDEIHWYVARAGEQVGPLTDAQLRIHAEKGDLKPDDQVWRPGFENWQRAGDILGLIQAPTVASRPPPLPRSASTAPPAQNSSSEKHVGPTGAVPDPKLVGVRGWLLFLCVALTILGPLAAMGEVTRAYEQTKALFSTVAGFKSFFNAVLVLSVVQILASFFIGVMLWSRQPGAHRFAQWFLLANIGLTCVAPFLIYLFVNMPAGSGGQVLSGALPDIIRTAVPSLIWYWYLEKSKRVRATFADF